jgi:hypothetical protein
MTMISEYHRAERHHAMEQTFTRRQFLTYLLVTDGVAIEQAEGMVSDLATAQPFLDMDEALTWAAWLDLGQVDITPPPVKGSGVKRTRK